MSGCIRKWVICATKGCAGMHGSGVFPAVSIVMFIGFVVSTSLCLIVAPMRSAVQLNVFTALIWVGAIGGTLMLLILRIVDPGTLRSNPGPPDQQTVEMLQAANIDPLHHDNFRETITREQIDPHGHKYESKYCITCHLWRTEAASHCRDCGHCVERLDHHCGATGVCIAKSNLRFFIAFLFFTGLGGSAAFAACVARFIEIEFWTPDPWSNWDPYVCLFLGLIFINCVNLLGFFVATFINALYGETYKERLKAMTNQPLAPQKTLCELWIQTCRPSSWVKCWHEVLCLELNVYVSSPKVVPVETRRNSKTQNLMETPAVKEEV